MIRQRFGLPADMYRVKSQIATSCCQWTYPQCTAMDENPLTSPKIWEISGEVIKSPFWPKTSP
jgi:hypothetical protein